MKKLFILYLFFICLNGCDVDQFLYNNTKLSSNYDFNNNNKSPLTFELEKTKFPIADNEYSVFSLNSEGNTIWVAYIGDKTKISTDTVIVYCHGNSPEMNYSWYRARILAYTGGKSNYGFVMMDYRGFGHSSGVTTHDGIVNDVATVLKWLKGEGLTNERTIMYGFSLGSLPSISLCANPQYLTPNKLILEAPLSSATVLVQDGLGISLPIGFFSSFKTDMAELIKKTTQPLLLIYGDADDYLNPATHGEIIYKNQNNGKYKEKIIVPKADHTNVPFIMGFEIYQKKIEDFIKTK